MCSGRAPGEHIQAGVVCSPGMPRIRCSSRAPWVPGRLPSSSPSGLPVVGQFKPRGDVLGRAQLDVAAGLPHLVEQHQALFIVFHRRHAHLPLQVLSRRDRGRQDLRRFSPTGGRDLLEAGCVAGSGPPRAHCWGVPGAEVSPAGKAR
jgi:hypothetical protein